MITQEQLKEVLNYDESTGVFTWKWSLGKAKKDGVAGCIGNHGYWQITIMKKNYRAHRLVWLWLYGSFPMAFLDHINGIKTDNRRSNLREVTALQNSQNKRKTLGTLLKGVGRNKKRFYAMIRHSGKRHYLGNFKTEQEAHQAYCLAAKKHFGEFANFGHEDHGYSSPATQAI